MGHGVAHDEARPAPTVVTHRVYWCGVASRAHLVYGASWIRTLGGRARVTLFPTHRFMEAPGIGIDDVRSMLPPQVAVDRWDSSPAVAAEESPSLLSVGAVGLKPLLALRRTLGLRRLPVVVTDEGLGSYGNWRSRRQAWAREGVREPWLSVRTTAVTAASAALTTRRWALYEERSTGWSLNPSIAGEFHRHASRTSDAGGAVFLSQPWPELGVMTETAYQRHVAGLADACAQAGLSFTVHPHPAERPSRYAHWDVHDSHGLAELDQQTVNATVLLGASSTGMLNVAAVHGVPALRVATAEITALERRLTRRQASLLTRFLGRPVAEPQWTIRLSALRAASGSGSEGRS